MTNTEQFPQLSPEVAELCAASSSPIVRGTPQRLQALLDLEAQFPARYGWRYHDDNTFHQHLKSLNSAKEINTFYWLDQSRNAEAHACMCVLRACELLKPAVRSLNIKEVIAPAVLARSFLELSVTFVRNINLIDNIIQNAEFPPDTVIASTDFEEAVVRMIWGTRLGDPAPHLKQTNILTSIQKVSKHPQASDLLPTYEYLCELAHPNVMGNARFWGKVEAPRYDGSVRIVIEKVPKSSPTVEEITEKVLWALGWSSECVVNAFMINRKALELLANKLQAM